MPYYEFQCENCKNKFDVATSMTNIQCIKVYCPDCHSNNVHRKYGLFAFILKGNGFYKTDNREDDKE
jgi:putative FmdB family regulatory protein